jgi:hypothetical protein
MSKYHWWFPYISKRSEKLMSFNDPTLKFGIFKPWLKPVSTNASPGSTV